ncbi:MAG: HAD family hydrolase [Spirochaetota bacterium]
MSGPYKLIVSDVDGCIAPEESAAWDLAAFGRLAALVRGREGGAPLPLVLCTGRPQPYVEVLMKLLDVRFPAICESGAVIYTLHDNRCRFGPGVTEEGLSQLREIKRFIVHDLVPRCPYASYQFGKEAHLSLFSENPDRLAPLADEIRAFAKRFGDEAIEIGSSHYYLNISLSGVTKGSALRQLVSEIGVAREEIAAIGDTAGDLPLREEAAFFAVPANATADVKARADYVSPHADVRGVIDILGRITVS